MFNFQSISLSCLVVVMCVHVWSMHDSSNGLHTCVFVCLFVSKVCRINQHLDGS